jgi:NADH-quinone oxidoreductase subunit M
MLLLQACLFGTFTALNFFHWFLLGAQPHPRLLPHQALGRPAPRRRRHPVPRLHHGRQRRHAALLPRHLPRHPPSTSSTSPRSPNPASSCPPSSPSSPGTASRPQHLALLLFAGAFLGFAVKVPLFPFHTWLPDAYAEAPTGTTILLTGAMSKMGLYGFLRILLPIFGPQMQIVLTPLLWLAVATIVLSAYAALAQKDLKRIFAYSSINHLGYCLLAIFAILKFTGDSPSLPPQKYAAMNGVFLQMFNHGLTAATIFWFIALLEQRSGGLRGLDDFGGLRKVAPVFTGLMGIALFSSLGLPGLNGFVGEFLIFKGSFPLVTWATSLSVLGLLLTAIFILGSSAARLLRPTQPKWAASPTSPPASASPSRPPSPSCSPSASTRSSSLESSTAPCIQLVQQLKF